MNSQPTGTLSKVEGSNLYAQVYQPKNNLKTLSQRTSMYLQGWSNRKNTEIKAKLLFSSSSTIAQLKKLLKNMNTIKSKIYSSSGCHALTPPGVTSVIPLLFLDITCQSVVQVCKAQGYHGYLKNLEACKVVTALPIPETSNAPKIFLNFLKKIL